MQLKKAINTKTLYQSTLLAFKNKKQKQSAFLNHANKEITTLLNQIKTHTYTPLPPHTFTTYKRKKRTIHAPHFRDCVLHYTLYNALYPLFAKSFITQSHGCVKGKGLQSALFALQNYTKKSKKPYYLQMDISKFYQSIQKEVLEKILSKKIKDKELLNLLLLFTPCSIGNLLSQFFGLIVLNALDHFIKRNLRVKFYVRYVDDFVLLNLDLKEALFLKEVIKEYLHTHLKLSCSKIHIGNVNKDISFCGFRVNKRRVILRKCTYYRLYKLCKSGTKEQKQSALSCALHTKTYANLKQVASLES